MSVAGLSGMYTYRCVNQYTGVRAEDVRDVMSDEDGRFPYLPEFNAAISRCHWGQRKCFFGELDFLTRVRDEGGVDLGRATVVYVGAVGGTEGVNHIPLLYDMFPTVRFVLFDMRHFDAGLYAHPRDAALSSVHSGRDGFFDDSRVARVRDEERAAGREVLFVCDVRLSSVESEVLGDMLSQMRWGVGLGARYMLLKMRPPYAGPGVVSPRTVAELRLPPDLAKRVVGGRAKPTRPGVTDFLYLKGDVVYQVNAKSNSAETRLFVRARKDGKYALQMYDIAAYEERCQFYNERTRGMRVIPDRHLQEVADRVEGWDFGYEAARELRLIRRHLGMERDEREVCRAVRAMERWFREHLRRSLWDCGALSMLAKAKRGSEVHRFSYDNARAAFEAYLQLQRRAARGSFASSAAAAALVRRTEGTGGLRGGQAQRPGGLRGGQAQRPGGRAGGKPPAPRTVTIPELQAFDDWGGGMRAIASLYGLFGVKACLARYRTMLGMLYTRSNKYLSRVHHKDGRVQVNNDIVVHRNNFQSPHGFHAYASLLEVDALVKARSVLVITGHPFMVEAIKKAAAKGAACKFALMHLSDVNVTFKLLKTHAALRDVTHIGVPDAERLRAAYGKETFDVIVIDYSAPDRVVMDYLAREIREALPALLRPGGTFVCLSHVSDDGERFDFDQLVPGFASLEFRERNPPRVDKVRRVPYIRSYLVLGDYGGEERREGPTTAQATERRKREAMLKMLRVVYASAHMAVSGCLFEGATGEQGQQGQQGGGIKALPRCLTYSARAEMGRDVDGMDVRTVIIAAGPAGAGKTQMIERMQRFVSSNDCSGKGPVYHLIDDIIENSPVYKKMVLKLLAEYAFLPGEAVTEDSLWKLMSDPAVQQRFVEVYQEAKRTGCVGAHPITLPNDPSKTYKNCEAVMVNRMVDALRDKHDVVFETRGYFEASMPPRWLFDILEDVNSMMPECYLFYEAIVSYALVDFDKLAERNVRRAVEGALDFLAWPDRAPAPRMNLVAEFDKVVPMIYDNLIRLVDRLSSPEKEEKFITALYIWDTTEDGNVRLLFKCDSTTTEGMWSEVKAYLVEKRAEYTARSRTDRVYRGNLGTTFRKAGELTAFGEQRGGG